MQSICRGCQRVLDTNVGKNIFDNDIQIKCTNENNSCDKNWNMKLCTGIELITGEMVVKEEKLPQCLCDACYQNVEAFVNFRFQLLKCKDNFMTLQKISESCFKEDNISQNETISKSQSESSCSYQCKDHGFLSKLKFVEPVSKVTTEDLVNVDDNSNTSFDVNVLYNNDGEADVSSTCRLQNDQENSNLNNSDHFNENIVNRPTGIDIKISDYDIESEIDVCSGEDDEVLELDVQKSKNETVEINSSSESDIEVCDYEPSSKKGNYNTLSPIMKFR